jgi:glycosyltransferase involved in cell wall biosynthesis
MNQRLFSKTGIDVESNTTGSKPAISRVAEGASNHPAPEARDGTSDGGTRPVRVLHVFPSESGAAYFRGLAENFDRSRFDFHFLTLERDDASNEPLRQLRVSTRGLGAGRGALGLVLAASRLTSFLRGERYDLVHLHLFPSLAAGGVARWFRKDPIFVLSHHYGREAFLYRRNSIGQWMEKTLCRSMDHIIAVSLDVSDYLQNEIGIASDRLSLIHYGFDFDSRHSPRPSELRQALRKELGLDSFFVVGSVARLHWTKGHRYLMEAVARLKHQDGVAVRLLLLGTGPDEDALKARARELGIFDDVEFLGWRSDPFAYYEAMDAFCHPSLQKGYEQVTVEAMALGKAVVATPVGIAREILRNGENGLVVPSKDSAAIYEALALLQRSDELRNRLGTTAAEHVRALLPSRREMTRRYEDLYVRLLARKDVMAPW